MPWPLQLLASRLLQLPLAWPWCPWRRPVRWWFCIAAF